MPSRSPSRCPCAATACGGGGGGGGGGGDKLVIGIKFDQPGLGLKNPDGTFTGFDVDVANYVAKELGYDPDKIEFKESPSAQRENADPERPGRLHRRDVLDHRRPQGEGRLRRPVPGRRAEPAGQGRQHRHHRPGGAGRQEPLLGDRLDLGAEGQGQVRRRAAAGVRHLLGVRRGAEDGAVDAVTTDDVILAGLRRAEPGQVQGRRQAVLRGELRHRPEEGRHRVAPRSTTRSRRWKPRRMEGRVGQEPRAGRASPRPPPPPIDRYWRRRRRSQSRGGFHRVSATQILRGVLDDHQADGVLGVGALILGTVLAAMRLAPVPMLNWIGTSYVNIVRNTPLTLIILFCSFGLSQTLGITLATRTRRRPSTTATSGWRSSA